MFPNFNFTFYMEKKHNLCSIIKHHKGTSKKSIFIKNFIIRNF